MAKLITDHDPYHLHKTLGVLVLLHFIYRIGLTLIRGFVFCTVHSAQEGLCTDQQVHFDAAGVILHGLLSWSSLLLPLPQKRNFSSPMIWTEFRFHSITFATRGVISSVVSIYGLWPEQLLWNYASKVALILGTCYTADFITAKYGCKEQRTTNAMPYPDVITPEMQKNVKYNYAMKQMAAALSCISESPTLPWATLGAIQGAPLLMTLVRKGKVTSLTYHRTYILQLASPMYIFLLGDLLHWNHPRYSGMIQQNAKQIFVVAALHFLATLLRIHLRQTKLLTWTVCTAAIVFLTKVDLGCSLVDWLHSNPIGIFIVVSRIIIGSQGVMRHYVPVFTLADKAPEDWEDLIMDPVIDFVKGVVSGTISVRAGTKTSSSDDSAVATKKVS